MFHESVKKQFNWNLMYKIRCEIGISGNTVKAKFHGVSFPLHYQINLIQLIWLVFCVKFAGQSTTYYITRYINLMIREY